MSAKVATKRRGGLLPDKYLSQAQIDRILKYLKRRSAAGSRRAAVNEFAVLMMLFAGLRAEELLSLRIRNLPCFHTKDAIEVEHGKGNVSRSIVIPDWLSKEIRRFVKVYRKNAKPGSALIPSERGRRRIVLRRYSTLDGRRTIRRSSERSARMTYSCLWSKLMRIGRAAGIGKLHPHMLRHTYLSQLYNINQDLRFVQDQAGHKDPKTTAIYTATAAAGRIRQVQGLPKPSHIQITNAK